MTARTAAKKQGGLWERRIRRTIADAITQTGAAFEKDALWREGMNRKFARGIFSKARRTKDTGWRTRFLNEARRLRDWRSPRAVEREAWPLRARHIEVWPSQHHWNRDRVNVRVYDSRGVPVVTVSVTGTLDFIDGLARTVYDFVSQADSDGKLDQSDATAVDYDGSLPPEAKGL